MTRSLAEISAELENAVLCVARSANEAVARAVVVDTRTPDVRIPIEEFTELKEDVEAWKALTEDFLKAQAEEVKPKQGPRYTRDLHERHLKAPCSHCSAAPGEPCLGAWGRVKSVHVARKDAAKRLGFVKGGGQ